MSICRSCDAPIIWATTAAGKAMPLDPDPVEGGNVEAVRDVHGRWSVVAVHAQPPVFAGPLYLTHFVTCPHAEEHRR